MNRLPRKKPSTNRRHLVWIRSATKVRDAEGGFTTQWANKEDVQTWASISPIQARHQTQYKAVGVDATHLVKVSGYTDIEEKDEILFGTRTFEVLTVENMQESDFEKVCTCLERR